VVQRRARHRDGKIILPMTLANMRACGGWEIATRPNWRDREEKPRR
jgi:hypothetical protein